MSFSYTLFLVLLLLAPGFGLWAGLRIGERPDMISQAPERPGSTYTLIVIIFGALLGHMLLSTLLAVQASICAATVQCVTVSFDPNVYREILSSAHASGTPGDWAFPSWFLSLLLPALILGIVGYAASHWRWVRDLRETATFGWLKRWIDLGRRSDSFIIAYVVTTLEHEGANVAYEGIVEAISLDDNRAITMLVLRNCDRFLVQVSANSVRRIDLDHIPIPLIQLDAKAIANVALEVFQYPGDEGEDD